MVLMSEKRIARSLHRMAFEILEYAGDHDVMLIGINVRGYAVANLLNEFLMKVHPGKTKLIQMDAEEQVSRDQQVTVCEPGTVLVFVDDVIFSGLTLHRAMLRFPNLEDAQNILVAALIDRGHRRLPIRADITGMHVPTKFDEHIRLRLQNHKPYEVELLPWPSNM
jgi:pyrimidine operon attenuation protein/uracil phosphoribosyltransferase